MPAKSCVPEPELARFVHGELDAEALNRIAEHVDSCEPCQDTVVMLAEQSNTFVESIRAAGEDADEPQEHALKLGLKRMLSSMRAKPKSAQSANGSSPDHPQVASPGQIGPYRVQQQLGQGGMGHVYQATHTKLKRTVALKVLPASRWANSSAVSRFEREMEAIGALDHENIVRASDAGEDQGMHYLVMEYIDGLDLSRLVNRTGPLPVSDACEVARQCAVGLHHAHENGLVHRDIKPSNLMIAQSKQHDSQVTLKILDLGLALLGDEHLQEGHELTTVGTLMGTLDYMSPEQGIDSHSVDQRTDIYSLGATLFKLLTGRAPYADPQYSTLMKKMTALATKRAPSIGSVRSDLPQELVAVIDRMLSRDPDERFESADDVAKALVPFCEEANVGKLLRRAETLEDPLEKVTPRVPVTALLNDATTMRQSAGAIPTASKSSGGNRWNGWLIALAAAGAAGLAGILFQIATDYGELTIRSDDPNATVTVSQHGESVKELRIKNGEERVRLRVGTYDLEVNGIASVSIAPMNVEVTRGASRIVKVVERPPSPADSLVNHAEIAIREKEAKKQLVLEEAKQLASVGKLDAALQKYDEILRSGWDAKSALKKAIVLREMGWFREADRVLGKIAVNGQHNFDAEDERTYWLQYGKNCVEIGESRQAIDILRKGLDKVGLTDAALWFQMGVAMDAYANSDSQVHNYDQMFQEARAGAILAFEKALDLDPEHSMAKAVVEKHREEELRQEEYARDYQQLQAKVQSLAKSGNSKLDEEFLALLNLNLERRREYALAAPLIAPSAILNIEVLGTPPERPIAGRFAVESDGNVNLGPGYGRVRVDGMLVQEAQLIIGNRLLKDLVNVAVSVSLVADPQSTSATSAELQAENELDSALFGPGPNEEQNATAARLTVEAEQFAERGQLKEALEKYSEALVIAKTFERSYGKAKVLQRMGWMDMAFNQLKQARHLNIPAEHNQQFIIDYATAAIEKGEYNEAVNVLGRQLNGMGLTNSELWFQFGLAQREQALHQDYAPSEQIREQLASATTSFKRALQLEPDHRRAKTELEILEKRLNDEKDAAAKFREDEERLADIARERVRTYEYEIDDELRSLIKRVRDERAKRGTVSAIARSGLRLKVVVPGTGPEDGVNGVFLVDSQGGIHLGTFGWVEVAGLTMDEIMLVFGNHLKEYLKRPTAIVTLADVLEEQTKTRIGSSPSVTEAQLEILNQFVESKLKRYEQVQTRMEVGGTMGQVDALQAKADVTLAKIRVAEATADHVGRDKLLTELLEVRQGIVAATKAAYDAGSTTGIELARAEEDALEARLRLEGSANSPSRSALRAGDSAGPVYKGHDYKHWLRTLQSDRDPEAQKSAIEALGLLGEENSREASRALFAAMRTVAGTRIDSNVLVDAISNFDREHVVDAMRFEIQNGNERSRRQLAVLIETLSSARPGRSGLLGAIQENAVELLRLRLAVPPQNDDGSERESKTYFFRQMLAYHVQVDVNEVRNELTDYHEEFPPLSQGEVERILKAVPDLPAAWNMLVREAEHRLVAPRLVVSHHVSQFKPANLIPVAPKLIEILESIDEQPHFAKCVPIIVALGKMGEDGRKAIPVLKKIALGERPRKEQHVAQACIALARIQEEIQEKELASFLEKLNPVWSPDSEKNRPDWQRQVRREVVEAIAKAKIASEAK